MMLLLTYISSSRTENVNKDNFYPDYVTQFINNNLNGDIVLVIGPVIVMNLVIL